MGYSVFDTIQSFSGHNEYKINSNLFDIRKNMENYGLNIKYFEEIQIGKFIFYFLKILNSILNEVVIDENDEKKMKAIDKELGYLSPNYEFQERDEENVLNKIKEVYNKRISSLISRNFINVIKIKKICKCKYERFSFSMINYIPFNVNFITKNCNGNNLHIKELFKYLSNDVKSFYEQKEIKCQNCQEITVNQEYKSLYKPAKNLIIILNRGENCENKTFIDFDEKLELLKIQYQLIGIIMQKEDGEYFSLIRNENNIWCNNGDNKNILSFEVLKPLGTIISLFYYCNNDNMIFESNLSNSSFGQQFNNLSLSEGNVNINPNNAIYNGGNINNYPNNTHLNINNMNNGQYNVMNNMGQGGQNINYQFPPNNNMNPFVIQNNSMYNNYNNAYNFNMQVPNFIGQNILNMNYNNNNNLQMNNIQTPNSANFNLNYNLNNM
jgi:hypothetical protein